MNKSQQHVLGSLIIIIILLLAAIPAMMFINFTDITKAEILEDYEHGWDHYIQFTIDHDYIDEDLTAFPVLVVIPTAIGSQANNGDSIRFLNYNLTEVYYHDIDTWDGAGDSYVWVRINDTSSTENTNVVMFYGNATASDISSNQTWNENYTGVWHMGDASGGVSDNTSNDNDGVENGNPTYQQTGQIGYSILFDGTGDYFSFPGMVTTDVNTSTYDFWVYGTSATDATRRWVSTTNASFGSNSSGVRESGTSEVQAWTPGGSSVTSGLIWNNSWQYFSLNIDSTNGYFYNNITRVGIIPGGGLTAPNFYIGGLGAGESELTIGYIDEVRVSNVKRSEAWSIASYHTMNQTTGFLTFDEIDAPVINTNTTTGIGTTSATFNGYLQLNGSVQTWYGLRYGLSEDSLTNNVTVGTNGTNYTTFNYAATGLNEGTVYYVQAWANSSNGFSVGTTKAFWTNSTWANLTLNNRTRIVINHTFIDEDLVNFPVLVMINSTVGPYCDSGNSIRFYKNSTTQYYYETDTWNVTENSSVWVNVTLVYKDVDTIFYMYYNDTNAVSNSSSPNTWNGNYVLVQHMNGATYTQINDSTSNNNDVIGGAGCTFQQPGQIGYAIDFDRASNAFLNITDAASLEPTTMTVECWTNFQTVGNSQVLISKHEDVGDKGGYLLNFEATNKYRWQAGTNDVWGAISITGNTVFADTGNWRYTAVSAESDTAYLNVNTTVDGSAAGISIGDTVKPLWIGRDVNNPGNSIDGLIDEVRISNIARSEAWIDVTFHSQNQTPGFLTFSGEEGEPSAGAFQIIGLTDNRITWQGQPNSYAWCNATGTANETLELNMTINATTNITQIYVWVGDSNDTGNYLNASNISVVFSSDNTTWDTVAVNTTSFANGGSNVTLNISTWTDTNGMYGTNPFNGTGLTDKTASIYCRFRLDILTIQAVDIYWNSTVWKIYIGYIV